MLETIIFNAERFEKEEDFNMIDFTENTIILCNNCRLMNTLREEILNTINGEAEYNDYWCDEKDIGKAKLDICFGLQQIIDINGQKITLSVEPAIIYKARNPEDIWFFNCNIENKEGIYPMLIFKGSREIWNAGKDTVYKALYNGQFGCYDKEIGLNKYKIREILSKEIFEKMSDQSAANVLRNIISDKSNIIDWNSVSWYLQKYMPELKNTINNINC